ncbi:urease accessory protein UreE [Cyanobium sp. CH-040]|nr:urease accessory protein UreE [Cyanobium sp. CH-040]
MDPPVFRSRHPGPPPEPAPAWRLPLTADERSRCRGLRRTACGVPVLLQLPRGEALRPGEWLCCDGPEQRWLQVTAAPEPLLRVRAGDALALLQAAYHLGNRHVALEIRPAELRLPDDPVLAHLLEHRGLEVLRITAPFEPESGAYDHSHSHDPSPGAGPG